MRRIIDHLDEFKVLVDKDKEPYENRPHVLPESDSDKQEITVCVRYRPVLPHEKEKGFFGCFSLSPPNIINLHKPIFNLSMHPSISGESVCVDMAFGERHTNEEVYNSTTKDLIKLALGGGVGTLFAYGQTSSGKTHTLIGIQENVAKDIFCMAEEYQQKFSTIALPTASSLLPPPLSSSAASKNRLYSKPPAKNKSPTTTTTTTTTNETTLPSSSSSSSSSNETKENDRKLQIYISFFELLGNSASDLLNEKKPVAILEDKFGDIQLSGILEKQICSTEEFIENIKRASSLRQSATTLKNDSSSRSHAVCRVRVKNPLFPSSENGVLMLVDLAGSERAADTKDHSSERLAETKEINSSLMALKDCIRARAMASNNADSFVHVPYRSSKLTVLMKDAFELSATRPTKTVVIAHVSPVVIDVAHSTNTLRYVAPLKVPSKPPKKDKKSPATWTHEETVEWIKEAYNGKVDPDVLCPFESGLQLCRIPEAEYMRRIMMNESISEKLAKKFYMKLWELIVDARTRKRQEVKKLSKDKH